MKAAFGEPGGRPDGGEPRSWGFGGGPDWFREGRGARPGPGPGCWSTGAEGSGGLSAVGRLPDPGFSVWLARRGGAAGREAGLAPLTWGGVVAWAAAASNCALLTLPPPPPAAAGTWLLRGSQSQHPRVRGACGLGYFLPHLKASVGSLVLPSLFPFLRPAHFALFLLAMLVVLLSGIGCFLGRSLPARNAPLQS